MIENAMPFVPVEGKSEADHGDITIEGGTVNATARPHIEVKFTPPTKLATEINRPKANDRELYLATGQSSVEKNSVRDENAFLLRSVRDVYVAADDVHTLILPYTPVGNNPKYAG